MIRPSSAKITSVEAFVKKEIGKKWYSLSSKDKKTIKEISHFQKNSKELKRHVSLLGQYEELGLA